MLHLLINTNNDILTNPKLLNIPTLNKLLLLTNSSNIDRCLNSNILLSQITLARIKEWLTKIWQPTLTKKIILSNQRKTLNFTIINQLIPIYKNNISLNNSSLDNPQTNNQTKQLNLIYNFLPKQNTAMILSLRNNQILYIEQLLTADNQFLLPWKNIYLRIHKPPRGPTPTWYKNLSNQIKTTPISEIWPNINLSPTNPFLNTLDLITLQNQNKNHWSLLNTQTDYKIRKITNFLPSQITIQIYQILSQNTNSILLSQTSNELNINYNQLTNIKCKTQKENQQFRLSINQQEIQALHKIYHSLSTPITHILPEITISSPDISLIQNTITNQPYQNQIINLYNQILLLNSNNLHFYTDASIKNSQTPNIKTGIAWILQNNTQTKFNTSISNAPNSTRAELSIFIFLFLTLPTNSKIHIHLDNLSAIQILKNNLSYNSPTQTKQNN